MPPHPLAAFTGRTILTFDGSVLTVEVKLRSEKDADLLISILEANKALFRPHQKQEAPITHRCIATIGYDGAEQCQGYRRADGSFHDICGDPCSWIMGKAGVGRPAWKNIDSHRRDPSQPDEGWE